MSSHVGNRLENCCKPALPLTLLADPQPHYAPNTTLCCYCRTSNSYFDCQHAVIRLCKKFSIPVFHRHSSSALNLITLPKMRKTAVLAIPTRISTDNMPSHAGIRLANFYNTIFPWHSSSTLDLITLQKIRQIATLALLIRISADNVSYPAGNLLPLLPSRFFH